MVAQPSTSPIDDLIQNLAPTVNNREMLQQLETERESLSAQCLLVGTAMILGVAFWNSGMALALAPLTVLLNRLTKVSQLVVIVSQILDEFEPQGIELFSRFEVPGHQPIDLFIRFPNKEFLLISIRSLGDCKIVYNQNTSALYARRKKKKGVKIWLPSPLIELSEQETWLRKNKRELFGGTSKDSRRPLAKVLVLWNLTHLSQHAEELYSEINGSRFLCIRQRGTVYLIESDQVGSLIEAYLARNAT